MFVLRICMPHACLLAAAAGRPPQSPLVHSLAGHSTSQLLLSSLAGKIKRALKLLFGAAHVSLHEVAGEQWVSPDELRWGGMVQFARIARPACLGCMLRR